MGNVTEGWMDSACIRRHCCPVLLVALHMFEKPQDCFVTSSQYYIQESTKEWAIGCVIPAPWPPLAAATHITQPRACSAANPCTVSIYANTLVCNCDVGCGGCITQPEPRAAIISVMPFGYLR